MKKVPAPPATPAIVPAGRSQERITEEHLRGLAGLTRSAAAILRERQPATVREALELPGVGRRTTRHLLELGLLRDPEGIQEDLSPHAATVPPLVLGKQPSAKVPWAFAPRFRRGGMGWKSRPAVQRVREAVTEIVREARRDPHTAADGAVLFLEKVSPALERVDGSSGSIGTAVNRAIENLVKIIAAAPADRKARDAWLERLYDAVSADDIPYLETLGEFWGDLCASPELASAWADRLKPLVQLAFDPDPRVRGYFKGTSACLSSLLAAGRHGELLGLLEANPRAGWYDRKFGVRALVAMGRKDEALRYAEASRDRYSSPIGIADLCEEILLSSGGVEEAYRTYSFEANQGTTHLATFRAVAKKYPHKKPAEILADLVGRTPGEEGKWYAAAKEVGLYAEAIGLARRSPCDPRTLTRAARDHATANPVFALESGLAALHWIVQGCGFEITGGDVLAAYGATMRAAENAGCPAETRARIRALIATGAHGSAFVAQFLARDLGAS